jgi:flagellar biosynthesis protein FliR
MITMVDTEIPSFSEAELSTRMKTGLCLFLTFLCSGMAIYNYVAGDFSYPALWTTTFTTQCGEAPKDFVLETFHQNSLGFVVFGAYFGLLMKSNQNQANAATEPTISVIFDV